MKLWWTWLGVAAAGALAAGAGAGCGDDGTGGSGGNGASSSSPSASSGGMMTSSSTGEMSGSGGSMSGSGGSMSSSSSVGSGGSGSYTVCSECTDMQKGAYAKECKTQYDACMANAECAKLFQCSYDGCTVDQAGGCCGLKCFSDNNASQAAIDLFKAVDGCVYCQTCNKPTLCETAEYCAVFKPGGDSVCP